MVCEWGMSDLGPLALGRKEQEVLGRDFNKHQEYSEKTVIEIDEQVKKIIQTNFDRSKRILQEKNRRSSPTRSSVVGIRVFGRRSDRSIDSGRKTRTETQQ